MAGEYLWSADRNFRAEVQAEGSLLFSGQSGSIHSIGTVVSGRDRTNGWSYWHAVRKGRLVCIDDLRKDYRKRHLG